MGYLSFSFFVFILHLFSILLVHSSAVSHWIQQATKMLILSFSGMQIIWSLTLFMLWDRLVQSSLVSLYLSVCVHLSHSLSVCLRIAVSLFFCLSQCIHLILCLSLYARLSFSVSIPWCLSLSLLSLCLPLSVCLSLSLSVISVTFLLCVKSLCRKMLKQRHNREKNVSEATSQKVLHKCQ